ncbi:MAG TPA: YraN family protein [Thermodesulfobacteriota bacterium]|nr:YraN family protein [Thermodesulfobacteriota bacterium]
MGSRIELGKRGEELAIGFLKKLHYKILEKNFRCKLGEIDIIALQGKTLVFIEVKTRSSLEYGSPQTSITSKKRKQLTKVAFFYLQKNRLFDRAARFDVVSVECDLGKEKVELIRNAFEISGTYCC